MTIEVEIKVELEDARGLEQSILERGGELVKRESQADLYLDHPQYSFADTDEALRIRTNRPKFPSIEETPRVNRNHEITYKGAKIDSHSKTRREISVSIDSAENMHSILDAVGFTTIATVKKERTYFHLDEISLTIDSVDGLGLFLEVEKMIEDKGQIESARNELFQLLDELLSQEYESIRESYLELLLKR